jgi:CheY-like chemotaxis protein
MNPEIQLVLMDMKLPFMNGDEATAAIRKFNPEILIIAQTAYAMLGDKEKAIDAGCNDYITKPLESKKLQELVTTLLLN